MGLPALLMRGEKMIYTLTSNPSLDYVMEMDTFSVGAINRSNNAYVLPGGKGINVSQVLNNLNVENVAILPVAGFTGDKLLQLLSERKINYDALYLDRGDTRINVKVLGREETQLNAEGPNMSKEETLALKSKIECLKDGDYLVLSGSVPKQLGGHFYKDFMECIKDKEVKVIVDTSGENLINVLSLKPFLVKPNKEELENCFHKTIDTEDMIFKLAKEMQNMGAKNVLVSLGGEGAVLLEENGRLLKMKAPKGKVVNTVGAGDSMVAGFLAKYVDSGDMEKALKQAVAAGSASAFSKNLATKEEIDALTENL